MEFKRQAKKLRFLPFIFAVTAYAGAKNDRQIDCVDETREKNVWQEWQGKSASACVQSGFVVDASFLYWQAKEDGLEYATKIDSNIRPDFITNKADLKNLNFEWNPGVKVSFGYIFEERQQWDISLTWTYLFSGAHAKEKANDLNLVTQSLIPFWNPLILGSEAVSASGDWFLHFNVFDLVLGRSFFVGKDLSVKPFAGIRGAWIEQDYKLHYQGAHTFNIMGIATVHPFASQMKAGNDFSGGGVRFGTDLQYFITSNWSVLGCCSGSLLYGSFDVHQIFQGVVAASSFLRPQEFDYKNHFSQAKPNLDAKLGVQWNTFFRNRSYRVSMGAFYNLSYWFTQNQLMNFTTIIDPTTFNSLNTQNRSNGNLAFQGLDVNLRLEF